MYSFYWSEARLVIAAIALFLGGVPPVFMVLGYSPMVTLALKLSWLISGLAVLYLLAMWLKHKQHLFGKKDNTDTGAFAVLVISGLNLGLTGLLGNNIGMSLSSNKLVFLIVGVLYLWAAYYLWNRYQKHGKHLF